VSGQIGSVYRQTSRFTPHPRLVLGENVIILSYELPVCTMIDMFFTTPFFQ
jgi:hypothetical protein